MGSVLKLKNYTSAVAQLSQVREKNEKREEESNAEK